MTIEAVIGFGLGCITFYLGGNLIKFIKRQLISRKFGVPLDHSILLFEFGKKISSAQDINSLRLLLTRELPGDIGISKSHLLFRKDFTLSSTENPELSLPINHTIIRWVASKGMAQLSEQKQINEMIPQLRTDLSWVKLWVPLLRGAELKGFWLVGGREEAKYSEADLHFFTSIAKEAVGVLDAMLLAEQEREISQELRILYRDLISVRETERARLAMELHDGVLQDLCAIARDIKVLNISNPEEINNPQNLMSLTNQTINSIRSICNDLRPPLLQQDILSALDRLVYIMDQRSSAPINISIVTKELLIPNNVGLTIFRISQESLNNAIQHSNASEISVRLTEYPNKLRLSIADDGKGIAGPLDSTILVAQGHFGLSGMRERAAMVGGKFEIHTAHDYGTAIIFEWEKETEKFVILE